MDFYVNGDAAPGGRFNFIFTTKPTTSVKKNEKTPARFFLAQNYPNPFNSTTIIKYELVNLGTVELSVYDISGRKITVLIDTVQNAGIHKVQWKAENLSSGIYVLSLKAGTKIYIRKILLIK